MRRSAFILIAVIAFAIAFEPVLHSHPLTHDRTDVHSIAGGNSMPCAICAAFTTQPALSPAELAPPLVLCGELRSVAMAIIVPDFERPSASRAPPFA